MNIRLFKNITNEDLIKVYNDWILPYAKKHMNEKDYFGMFKICQVCGKDIKKQKVMMCSKCKVAIKVEYQSLKKEHAKKVYKVLNKC